MSEIKVGTNNLLDEINRIPIDFDNGEMPIRQWAQSVTGIIDQSIIESNDSELLDKLKFEKRKATINMNNSSLYGNNGFYLIKSVKYIYTVPNTDFKLSFTIDNPAV